MLKLFVCLSALFVSASCGCLDNGDKEIGGSCYKFVSQKLSFEDARDWCHYKNPVTPSYLAHVGNQFTANFLASYGQSIFGASESFFWIGLSRNRTWMPWTWDNGYQAGYTNFGNNALSQNYAAEAISNTKWSTFGDDTKMYFVCSYDPTAPPTFGPPVTAGPTAAPTTTAVPVTTPTVPTTTECLPTDPTTFFFAYSNDLDKSTVSDALSRINDFSVKYSGYRKFSYFANLRFDLATPETAVLNDDLKAFTSSVKKHLPKAALGLKNDSAPSDVIEILSNYVRDYPKCGSVILLLVKRNPEEQNISELVKTLQNNYFMVYTSASDQLLGAPSPRSLYELSTRTNGFCAFTSDLFYIYTDQLEFIFRYPMYAVNVQVTGNDTKQLPNVYFPETSSPVSGITDHAHPLTNATFWLSVYQNNYNWKNSTNPGGEPPAEGTLSMMGWAESGGNGHHPVSVTYNYPMSTETIQLRYASDIPYDWPDYDQNY